MSETLEQDRIEELAEQILHYLSVTFVVGIIIIGNISIFVFLAGVLAAIGEALASWLISDHQYRYLLLLFPLVGFAGMFVCGLGAILIQIRNSLEEMKRRG